tara:strand:+ start:399 stop:551 length:153 start_codon:yes stop_codon:yes gene_type:complete
MIYLISSISIIVTLLIYTISNIKRELEELKFTKNNVTALRGWQKLINKER